MGMGSMSVEGNCIRSNESVPSAQYRRGETKSRSLCSYSYSSVHRFSPHTHILHAPVSVSLENEDQCQCGTQRLRRCDATDESTHK